MTGVWYSSAMLKAWTVIQNCPLTSSAPVPADDITVRGEDRLVEVACSRLVGMPVTVRALDVDAHAGELGDARESEDLGLEGHAGARGRGHRLLTGERGADDRADARDLVLRLEHRAAVLPDLAARNCMISVEGVIGYPPKKAHPAKGRPRRTFRCRRSAALERRERQSMSVVSRQGVGGRRRNGGRRRTPARLPRAPRAPSSRTSVSRRPAVLREQLPATLPADRVPPCFSSCRSRRPWRRRAIGSRHEITRVALLRAIARPAQAPPSRTRRSSSCRRRRAAPNRTAGSRPS